MAAGGLSPDPAGAGGTLPAKLGLARRPVCAGISLSALPDIRYRGQRHTTVMARLSRPFVSEALRPEFQELQQTLEVQAGEAGENPQNPAHSEAVGSTGR